MTIRDVVIPDVVEEEDEEVDWSIVRGGYLLVLEGGGGCGTVKDWTGFVCLSNV